MEDELLELNYKNPICWWKIGMKISGYNNNNVTGTIVDFDKFKNKDVIYVSWDDPSLNAAYGYRKYSKDYLSKEITKGNIKIKGYTNE